MEADGLRDECSKRLRGETQALNEEAKRLSSQDRSTVCTSTWAWSAMQRDRLYGPLIDLVNDSFSMMVGADSAM